MKTKEEYENLINNSPLFETDKEHDTKLYESLRSQFLNLLLEYCQKFIYPNRPLDDYSMPFIETATKCIDKYDKNRADFLNLFNHLFKRNTTIYLAKEKEKEFRKGVVLSDGDSKKIRDMIAYVNSRGLDINDLAVQERIANFYKIKLARVKELIHVNVDAVAVNSTIINDDGDEIELFDLQQSKELSMEDQFEQQCIVKQKLSKIDAEFKAMKNIPGAKRVLSMMLTANYLKEFDEEPEYLSYLKDCEFYSDEVAKFLNDNHRTPTAREIATRCEVSEQSLNRTYKNFKQKLKQNL